MTTHLHLVPPAAEIRQDCLHCGTPYAQCGADEPCCERCDWGRARSQPWTNLHPLVGVLRSETDWCETCGGTGQVPRGPRDGA